MPEKEYLEQCFHLIDGGLVWKARPKEHFKSHRSWAMWNAKFAGKTAGRKMLACDYRQVGVAGIRYLEHRVIAVMHGISTDTTIDHKDGCGLNNRPENLRSATQPENNRNTTGWKKKALRVGVFLVKSGRFVAACRVDGKQKHLGTFSTYAEAVTARELAEQKYFGEFSPVKSGRVAAWDAQK